MRSSRLECTWMHAAIIAVLLTVPSLVADAAPTDAPILNPIANMVVQNGGCAGASADQAISGSDPDGDALTFSKTAGPAFMTVTTTSPTTGNIHLAPGFLDIGPYSATVTASDGSLADSKSFSITVVQVNQTPVLIQPPNVTIDEGTVSDLIVFGSDPCASPLTFSKASGPLFVTVTTLNGTTGNVHFAPGFADAGGYTVSLRACNGFLCDTKSFLLTVNNICQGPPVAHAGGPYSGFIGIPIQFDGTASFDPDGGALAFAWDFGDGNTGLGAQPSHVYNTFGTYAVGLTVTGSCGSASDATTAAVGQGCTSAFTRGGDKALRLGSGRPTFCVQLEPMNDCYDNADVVLSSVVMRYTGGAVSEIHAIEGKTTATGDTDGDGVQEITVCFSKSDLRQLFSGLPAGENFVTVTITGDLSLGGQILAQLSLRVFATGGTALAASVSPNPFNPSAKLTFATTRAGFARVTLYDLSGRRVQTPMDEEALPAGLHALTIEGRAGDGTPLASGIYYFRIESAEGMRTGRFTLLK